MPLTPLILMLKINSWMQCKVQKSSSRSCSPKSSSRSHSPSSSSRSGSSRYCKQQGRRLVKMYPCSLHTNWLQHKQSLLVHWCLPLKCFIKIGQESNLSSQVNLKKMQNHIFSVLGIRWKHTTFLMRSKLDDFV